MPVKMSILGLMALGVLLGLAACNGDGGDGGDGGDDSDSVATPTPESTPTLVASPPPEVCPKVDDEVVQAMFAVLELDKSSYEQGEPVEMTMRLVNCASEPITRSFPNS